MALLDGRTTRRWSPLAVIALLTVLTVGCGGDGDGDDLATDLTMPTAPGTPAVDEPTSAGLTLNGDGIGELRFGEPVESVTGPLDAVFGPPTIDSYTGERLASGGYLSLLGAPGDRGNGWTYAHPALQIRCHPNGLCAVFGGASLSELVFTGWTYASPADNATAPAGADPVHTVDGVTLGSSTADFPGVVTRTASGCASSVGFANAAGSITAMFGDFYSEEVRRSEPAPGGVFTVVSLTAGTIMSFADGCA